MKRFLSAVIVAGTILFGIYYMIYYEGFYIPVSTDEAVELPFKTEGTVLLEKKTMGHMNPLP